MPNVVCIGIYGNGDQNVLGNRERYNGELGDEKRYTRK